MTASILSKGKFVFSGVIKILDEDIHLVFENERKKKFFEKIFYNDSYFSPKDKQKYVIALLQAFRNSTAIMLTYDSEEEKTYCEKLIKKGEI